ncbi:MAG TPA: mercury methylation corrinoid protein HgcA, partial [Desulfurivibrionaceae bacterium]|nr:mercury methylation corrinoid protein HgcA [Desulfurivibrionaceae bacterium]
MESPVGPVPRLATRLGWRDRLGTIRTRLGLRRNDYLVAPGLYCVGQPDRQAPVIVTANYKLTMDTLRKNLGEISAWILVLDTRGINVWCAAAHQTFGTAELVKRLALCRMDQVVAHRRLVVPQLGAAGVSAQHTRK